MKIDNMAACAPAEPVPLAFFLCPVEAGFPSPAEDWLEDRLDLNELLIARPAATFLLRVSGDSMTGAGIQSGAILVVDRSVTPKSGHIVVAALDGGLTVKRLQQRGGVWRLCAANPVHSDISLSDTTVIWGVVTASILRF